ncbi:MAG: TIGR01212 family radical SAM protein [Firmicutes bacterium]|nr:TIGR01212 family radical SAM protein [Bacillota bacterium]
MNEKFREYKELFGEQRFHYIITWLKRQFGEKTIKLAIDGGFTCPNRDGSKGYGGCLFCSDNGAGEFASNVEDQIQLYADKWPHAKYLGYFQNHTNTYAPVSELRAKYEAILSNPKIEGLVIGTRPDCLSSEVLDLLAEINKTHFLWVELGLQTMHEETAQLINRCYPLSVFEEAMEGLRSRGIKTVVHLILGLPGETREMMLDSVRYVAGQPELFGMKLHLLNVVKGSRMALDYSDYQPFASIEEYVNLVVECLELIPPQVTIHRLTGDAPRSILITPPWSFNKRTILNGINEQLHLRDTWQGKKCGNNR